MSFLLNELLIDFLFFQDDDKLIADFSDIDVDMEVERNNSVVSKIFHDN